MKPEDLTISDLVPHAGITELWHGRCSEIATIIMVSFPELKGTSVYGHYLGPVAADGYWGGRRGMPFQQHGWVLLPDGRILDPTRWSFTNEDAFIYLDFNDEDYDEGGNAWREAFARPCPGPDQKDKRFFKLDVSTETRQFIEASLHPEVPFDKIQIPQISWLANMSYHVLGPLVPDLYKALIKAGHSAFIPWDNMQRFRREHHA